MSGTIIRIDQLGDAIKKEIDAMNAEVIQKCNKAAEEVGAEGVRMLKASSPVRTDGYNRKYPPGSYAKSWAVKKDTNELDVQGVTIYNRKHYQLTHLLEFGHIIARTGGRSKAFPHIAEVNDRVSHDFVEKVEGMKL
jgi:hypothetical protein